MTEVADRYAGIAGVFGARLKAVEPTQWADPTPCPDWSVRDLVCHVINTQIRVLATLQGEEARDADRDGDLVAQWLAASGAISDAVNDPALATQTISGMFGEQPFATLVGRLVCTDTLVHTWDLARATGQDERLDLEAVVQSLAFLTPIDDAIRRPGGFAPKIDPAPDADEQTKFLNFCGRAI